MWSAVRVVNEKSRELRTRKARSDVTRIGEPRGELAGLRDAAVLFKVRIEARPRAAPHLTEMNSGRARGHSEGSKKKLMSQLLVNL